MGLFVKCCGGALLSAILVATVGNRNKDMATVLGLTACCLIAMAGLTYLRPVISFISQLEELGGLDHALISILLKIAGIGILAEIGTLVCNDSGSTSLGKGIGFLSTAVILWLSLPLYGMLLDLLQKILGGL